MAREEVRTDRAAAPQGAYSQAIVANGFLYTAGFGPLEPGSGVVVGDTVGEQTQQVMRNLEAVLAARGLDFSDVVKANAHLANLSDFAEFNAAYEAFLTPPYPVRTTVCSGLPNILVEVEVVAALRD